jgi:DnaJ-class molecular chaperone
MTKKKLSFEDAKKIIGLEDKDTKRELKRKFRSLAMIMHPDKGGEANKFQDLQSAYETLIEYILEDKATEDIYINGKPLDQYGKGYPITESARTCDRCRGNGYVKFSEKVRIEKSCPTCHGTGIFSYSCKKCNGSGKYIRNGKEIGECRLCSGSGRFYPENKKGRSSFWSRTVYIPGTMKEAYPCKECSGNGTVLRWGLILHNHYIICSECDGIGEIKMWNPIIIH